MTCCGCRGGGGSSRAGEGKEGEEQMLVKERESACVCLSRTSPTSLSLSVSLSLFLSPFLLRRLPLSFFALAHARVRTSSSTFSSFSSKVSVPHAPSSTPLSLFLSPFLLRSLPLYLRVGSRTGAHACSHNPPSLSPPSEEFVSHTSPTPTLLHLFFFLSLSLPLFLCLAHALVRFPLLTTPLLPSLPLG